MISNKKNSLQPKPLTVSGTFFKSFDRNASWPEKV